MFPIISSNPKHNSKQFNSTDNAGGEDTDHNISNDTDSNQLHTNDDDANQQQQTGRNSKETVPGAGEDNQQQQANEGSIVQRGVGGGTGQHIGAITNKDAIQEKHVGTETNQPVVSDDDKASEQIASVTAGDGNQQLANEEDTAEPGAGGDAS